MGKMSRFNDAVDFGGFDGRNFVVETSSTPPSNPKVNQLWGDTSLLGDGSTQNSILRYWDGHRWARMDGGGDIPNEMIYDRHVNPAASISWSKINHPTNLATTDQTNATDAAVSGLTNRVTTNETNISSLQAYNPTEQTRVNNALATKADLVGGKLVPSQVPAIAITSTKVYADTTARDADNANTQEGDVAIVTGVGAYIKDSTGAWIPLPAPTGGASSADLQAEINNRTAADTALGSRIDTEHSHHISGDAIVQGNIDAEVTARTNADSAEQTARIAGDNAVQASVTTEASNRTAADTALGGRIDQEITDRQAAVSGEATLRTTADNSIRSDFATADNAVRSEFASADAGLQTQINTKAADSTVVHLTGNETIAGVKTFNASPVAPTPTTPTQVTIKSYVDSADSAEVTNRTNADTALQGQITTNTNSITTLNGTGAGSVQSTADSRIAVARGAANGIAPLGSDSKIPSSYLPQIAFTTVRVVADNAALNALTGMLTGDVTVVTSYTDAGDSAAGAGTASFIYDGSTWRELSNPSDITSAEMNAAITAAVNIEVTNRTNADTALTTRLNNLGAGNGMVRSGDTFNVQGTTGRIAVTTDNVDIDSAYVGQSSITTLGTVTTGVWNGTPIDIARGGTGATGITTLGQLKTYLGIGAAISKYAYTMSDMVAGTAYSVPHGLNTKDIIGQLQDATTGAVVYAEIVATGVNTVSVKTDADYTDGAMRLIVLG